MCCSKKKSQIVQNCVNLSGVIHDVSFYRMSSESTEKIVKTHIVKRTTFNPFKLAKSPIMAEFSFGDAEDCDFGNGNDKKKKNTNMIVR